MAACDEPYGRERKAEGLSRVEDRWLNLEIETPFLPAVICFLTSET